MLISNKLFMKVFIISIFLLNSLEVMAYEPPPPSPDGTPPVGLSINGGIIYLFIAALYYGIYELKNRN